MSLDFDKLEQEVDRELGVAPVSVPPTLEPIVNLSAQPSTLSLYDNRMDVANQQQNSWQHTGAVAGIGRTLGRIPIRAAEDIYNAANEIFQFGEKAEWDEALFGAPINKVEDFAADFGSYLVTFLFPGGTIAKGVTALSKATIAAKTAKITATLKKTSAGRKLLKYSTIAAEGSIAGAVADYLNTETGDETGLEAIRTRMMEAYKGAIIGAGLNIGLFGLKKYVGVKLNVLRKKKKLAKAIERGEDGREELVQLSKALKKEEAVQSDVYQEVTAMDNLVKDVDIDNPSPSVSPDSRAVDLVDKPTESVVDDFVPTKEIDDVQAEILKGNKELEWYLNNGGKLPDQLNTLVALTKSLNSKFDPIFVKLIKQIGQAGKGKYTPDKVEALKKTLISMEKRLEQHKLLMKFRAIAGNYAGKSLRAFRGDAANFSRPFQYKEGTRQRLQQIDSMLEFIRGTRQGTITDDQLVEGIKIRMNNLEKVGKTGRLDTLYRRQLADMQEKNVTTIWERYKEEIGGYVVNHLTPGKAAQKALLDQFTSDTKKVITQLLPKAKGAKSVRSALELVQDQMKNPEKLRESLEEAITALEKSDLPDDVVEEAVAQLRQPLDTVGQRLFSATPSSKKLVAEVVKQELDKMGVKLRRAVAEGNEVKVLEDVVSSISKQVSLGPNEKYELMNLVREQLGDAISDIRNQTIRDFISSELHQKFMLSGEIADIADMSGRPLNEVRDYLIKTAKNRKQTPEDIQFLRKQRDIAKRELEQRVENAYFVELLERLSKMQQYQTTTLTNYELGVSLLEQWRYNMGMLLSTRTWFIGPVSAIMQLSAQPLHRALRTFFKTDAQKKAGKLGEDASAVRMALTELSSTYEYFNNLGDMWNLFFNTFKNGGFSLFNPKSIQRHAEYVKNAVDNNDPTQLMFKDRALLKDMIRLYVPDTPDSRGRMRKFFEDISDGTPEGGIGKALELMFSLSQRVMGALDDPVTLLGTRRALRAKATQDGLLQGLEGDKLSDFVENYMSEAITKDGGYPMWVGREELSDVEQLGLAVSFRADYTDQFLSATARSFAHWSRNGADAYSNPVKFLARWSVPFIKTPTAILQFTIDNIPGLAQGKAVLHWRGLSELHGQKKKVMQTLEDAQNVRKVAVTPNERKAAEQAIRTQEELLEGIEDKLIEQGAEVNATGITATAFSIMIMQLVQSSRITGTGSYLPEEMRENIRRNGGKFNHIYINTPFGEKAIDYSRMEPWSAYISAYADYFALAALTQQYPELEAELNTGASMIQSYMVEQLGNKYFVKGLFELIRPFVDEDYDFAMSGSSYPESLSPRVLRELRTVNEEFEKQYTDWKSKFMYRAFGHPTGQYVRNALGEKAKRQWTPDGWFNYFSPISVSEVENDPVLRELSTLWGNVGYLRQWKNDGVDTRNYRSTSGQTLYDAWMDAIDHNSQRAALQRLFRSGKYQRASIIKEDDKDITKTNLVNDIIRKYRNKAWKQVTKDPQYNNFYDSEGTSWKEQKEIKTSVPTSAPPTYNQLLSF
jgi:hypothetical protein